MAMWGFPDPRMVKLGPFWARPKLALKWMACFALSSIKLIFHLKDHKNMLEQNSPTKKFCDSPYSVSATFWPICHISHPLSKVPLYSLKIPCPTGSFCWNPSSVSNLTKTQLFQLCPPLLFQSFLDFNCAVVRYRERPESCYFVRPYYRKNFAALKFSAGTGPMSLTWGYYYPIGWYQAKNSLIGLVWIGYMGSNMPQKWHFGFCHFWPFWQFWGHFIAISSYIFSSYWV